MKTPLTLFLTLTLATLLTAQTRVAVIDLTAKSGVDEDEASLLTDTLRASIYKAKVFDLMNREDMNAVLKEVAFQQSGACDDTSCIVEMGNALGLEKMIAGSIGKLGERYSVTIKLVDIAAARNEALITEYYRGGVEELPEFVAALAWRIVNREEKLQGRRTSPLPGGMGDMMVTKNIKSPSRALVYSLLIPGLGQHYNGQHAKGVIIEVGVVGGMIYAVGGAVSADETDESMGNFAIGALVYMGSYIWGIIDAPITAGKINRGELSTTPSNCSTAYLPLATVYY